MGFLAVIGKTRGRVAAGDKVPYLADNNTMAGSNTFRGTTTIDRDVNTVNTVSVASNAGTVPVTYKLNKFTNSSAATMTITLATTGASDGWLCEVVIRDFSAATQTINWVNTEDSLAAAPIVSNGSTTLPLTVLFQYNASTSKWRCIAAV